MPELVVQVTRDVQPFVLPRLGQTARLRLRQRIERQCQIGTRPRFAVSQRIGGQAEHLEAQGRTDIRQHLRPAQAGHQHQRAGRSLGCGQRSGQARRTPEQGHESCKQQRGDQRARRRGAERQKGGNAGDRQQASGTQHLAVVGR